MEFTNMIEKTSYNFDLECQNSSELPQIPSAPKILPVDAPLTVYMEMGVFYLEESEC